MAHTRKQTGTAAQHKLLAALLLGAVALAPACTATRDQGSGGASIPGVHMAELNSDFSKVYLTNSEKNELVVVDAKTLGDDTSDEGLLNRAYIVCRDSGELGIIDLRTFELTRKKNFDVLKRVALGEHPTHMSVHNERGLLTIMNEDEGGGAVSFIDTNTDKEIKRLGGFFTPHFMRYSPDGKYGYVANLNAYHVTRVDLDSLEIDGHVALEGFDGPPNETLAPEEGGFGDAQIDRNGVMYAAHHETGRVIVYDTMAREKRAELKVGKKPWIAFADHPFHNIPLRHLVTNFGDRSVSVIKGIDTDVFEPKVMGSLPGDEESYGVNYSSLTPGKAFVMNRLRKDIAVVDTETLEIKDRIPVGGNTETAATTRDGKYIIAAVSGANRVVIIDAESSQIVKTFDNFGNYPWSVTIPLGQNYCH
jgi:DNA-binding beta-propeller fold protein YncE